MDPGSLPYNDNFSLSYTSEEGLFYEGGEHQCRILDRIVIDAGHGGKDHGCSGENSSEKEITLSVSLLVGKILKQKFPNVDILYTRKEDRFIPLHERIDFANQQHADLFISIHANAFEDESVNGTEVYVMGLHAAEENLEVAKRENASILYEENTQEHYDGFDPNSTEGQIILSMYQNSYLDKSIALASLISEQISATSGLKNRGVRQAGFVILRNASMPSVLIESGFLSNAADENLLLSASGQKNMARAIADAIEIYKYEQDLEYFEQLNLPSQYRVQIAAFSIGTDPPSIDDSLDTYPIDIVYEEGMKKMLLGRFDQYQDAKECREKLISAGYKDAFITQYKGKDRIAIDKSHQVKH